MLGIPASVADFTLTAECYVLLTTSWKASIAKKTPRTFEKISH